MNEARIMRMQEQIARYYETKLRSGQLIHEVQDVVQWLTAKIGSSRVERLWALALDGSNRVITWIELSAGSINHAPCCVREIARWALLQDATSVILAHNHPSGTTTFSPEDIRSSHAIRDGLKLLQMQLMDHIIVTAEGKYVSAKEEGVL